MTIYGKYGAVDEAGNVYILRQGRAAGDHFLHLIKLDEQGNKIASTTSIMTKGGTTQLSDVDGISIGPDGKIYLLVTRTASTTSAARDTGFVQIMDDQFNYITRYDVSDSFATSNVAGIHVAKDNKIYVFGSGDTTDSSVCLVLDDQGNTWKDMGSSV